MKALITLAVSISLISCHPLSKSSSAKLPLWIKGQFEDDYGIFYTINDSLFMLGSSARYHILQLNTKEQYLIVRNDENNPSEKGLYSRIDYMQFENMMPYTWGFCLTIYDAPDTSTARSFAQADRNNPRKGCNGFPFSRMKRTESQQ